MAREWRHLKLLKRGGRALSEDGASQTKAGGLAVECPACLQPGRNMAENMDDIPEQDRFVVR